MDVYARGEDYLRTRFMFRSENEIDKAISALRASRGGMPIEVALFAILDGVSLLSDTEWNAGKAGGWDPSEKKEPF